MAAGGISMGWWRSEGGNQKADQSSEAWPAGNKASRRAWNPEAEHRHIYLLSFT